MRHLHYRLSGAGLTETAVSQGIDLSEHKYCSVAATVRGVAEVTTEFEILQIGKLSLAIYRARNENVAGETIN